MEEQYEGIDRREARRVKVNFIISYKIDGDFFAHMRIAEERITAQVDDLSEKGMAIISEYNIPQSTNLLIKFTLVDLYAQDKEEQAKSMEIAAEVCYNFPTDDKKYRIGIAFTNLYDTDKQTIASFVQNVMSHKKNRTMEGKT